jgi:hypothetical protein
LPFALFVLCCATIVPALISAQAQTSPYPGCRSNQLKINRSDGPDGGAGNSALVYQATNTSRQACALSGVPRLMLLDEKGRPLHLTICGNCLDYIFPTRPVERLLLNPGASAHFLMGLRFADDRDRQCGRLSRVEVFLGDSGKSLTINSLGARVCGKIDVSAWRAGFYSDKELLPAKSR